MATEVLKATEIMLPSIVKTVAERAEKEEEERGRYTGNWDSRDRELSNAVVMYERRKKRRGKGEDGESDKMMMEHLSPRFSPRGRKISSLCSLLCLRTTVKERGREKRDLRSLVCRSVLSTAVGRPAARHLAKIAEKLLSGDDDHGELVRSFPHRCLEVFGRSVQESRVLDEDDVFLLRCGSREDAEDLPWHEKPVLSTTLLSKMRRMHCASLIL